MLRTTKLLLTYVLSLGVSIVSFSIQAASVPVQYHSTDCATRWNVDFCEEFDGLQDWLPAASTGYNMEYENTRPDLMPKLANGNKSAWIFYTGTTAAQGNWIGGTETGRRVWRGTKALTIDMGNTAGYARGPSRFGLYFGDTTNPVVGDGYSSVRIFYMVSIPRNIFITGCTSGDGGSTSCVGEHINDGRDYIYFAYFKFADANINCGFDSGENDPTMSAAICNRNGTYGEFTTVPGFHKNNYPPNGIILKNSPYQDPEVMRANQGGTLNNYLAIPGDPEIDKHWFGVEFWFRTEPGNTTFTTNMYIYDRRGNVDHVMQEVTRPIGVVSAQGKNWDNYTMGGNVSYSLGPTMDSAYYVDDFIVDEGSKGPIGPRYFTAVADDLPAESSPPNNINNWLRESLQ